jgi:hypothetical protein
VADYTVSIRLQATDAASPAIAQLNNQLKTLGTNTNASTPSTDQKSAWDMYSSAIGAAATAIGVYQAAGAALELVNQGENVHAVRMAFEALSGSTTQAAADLAILREATSGVMTDMELMGASNRLESMGLADSTAEMAELISMAQQLGSVMSPGSTAAQNIDNFTLMLANNSRLRLDSFGISSDAVKVRMDELKEAGYSVNEAFRLATLEQGRISLERLGDAATTGATNVDRLSTSISNNMNSFAEWAAGITNEALSTLDMLGQLTAAAAEYAGITTPVATPVSNAEYFGTGGGNGSQAVDFAQYQDYLDPGNVLMLIEAGYTMQEIQEQMSVEAQNYYQSLFGGFDLDAYAETFGGISTDLGDMADKAGEFGDKMNVSAGYLNQAHVDAVGVRNAMVTSLGEMDLTVLDEGSISEDLVAARAESAARIFSDAWNEALNAYGLDFTASTTEASGVETDRGVRNGQQLFTQEEADAIQTAADYYNDLLSDAQELNAAGLLPDGELAAMQQIADDAGRLADNAQRGADAFANMNLATALGQTGGGMGGEMNADVLEFMQQSGQFSESQIAQYQQQLELGTGQQTQASINYDEVIVPMIADIIEMYGADAGAAAIANMQSGMSTAAIAGMTDEQIAAAQAGMTGYSYQAINQFTGTDNVLTSEDKGMGGLSVAEEGGFDIDAYMQSTIQINQDWQSIDSASKSFTDNLTSSAAALDPMLTQVAQFSQQWRGLNGTRVRMTADIAININNESIFRDMILEVVRSNGGAVPGEGAPGGGSGGGGSGSGGGRPR